MTKHTALPWTRAEDGLGPLSLYGPDNKGIWHRDRSDEETEANARFIVTACNCHADLLEALRKIHNEFVLRDVGENDMLDEIATKAIRKAEETQ